MRMRAHKCSRACACALIYSHIHGVNACKTPFAACKTPFASTNTHLHPQTQAKAYTLLCLRVCVSVEILTHARHFLQLLVGLAELRRVLRVQLGDGRQRAAQGRAAAVLLNGLVEGRLFQQGLGSMVVEVSVVDLFSTAPLPFGFSTLVVVCRAELVLMVSLNMAESAARVRTGIVRLASSVVSARHTRTAIANYAPMLRPMLMGCPTSTRAPATTMIVSIAQPILRIHS